MNPMAIYVGLMVADGVYHRFKDVLSEGSDVTPKTAAEIQIPLTEEGSAIPMCFGKVRVRSPILAANGTYGVFDVADWGLDSVVESSVSLVYGLDMLFAIGIPFQNGINRIHTVWAGDMKLHNSGAAGDHPTLDELTGDGDHEEPTYLTTPSGTATAAPDGSGDIVNLNLSGGSGLLEWLNGNAAQEVVDAFGATSKTFLGDRLTTLGLGVVEPKRIGNYRGLMSAFMFSGAPLMEADLDQEIGEATGDPPTAQIHSRWIIGPNAQPPAYNFEISTYPNASLHLLSIGVEANPADVLWAIFRDVFGKLGLDYTRVDYETFRAAAETLHNEGHGYSRVFEGLIDAREVIDEIKRQIDGVIYEDMRDGLIKLKLIRADFDPLDILVIDTSNCERLENAGAGGWQKLVNKVRIPFENRDDDYKPGSASAQNGANYFAQGNRASDLVLQFPGVKTQELADYIAGRELDARSRPIAKYTAIVSREFWDVPPGTPVAVRWPNYNINGRIFRVARPARGTADANTMALDIIEDFFYLHRAAVEDTGGLPSFPGGAVG